MLLITKQKTSERHQPSIERQRNSYLRTAIDTTKIPEVELTSEIAEAAAETKFGGVTNLKGWYSFHCITQKTTANKSY
jgi:hypothetical protein